MCFVSLINMVSDTITQYRFPPLWHAYDTLQFKCKVMFHFHHNGILIIEDNKDNFHLLIIKIRGIKLTPVKLNFVSTSPSSKIDFRSDIQFSCSSLVYNPHTICVLGISIISFRRFLSEISCFSFRWRFYLNFVIRLLYSCTKWTFSGTLALRSPLTALYLEPNPSKGSKLYKTLKSVYKKHKYTMYWKKLVRKKIFFQRKFLHSRKVFSYLWRDR